MQHKCGPNRREKDLTVAITVSRFIQHHGDLGGAELLDVPENWTTLLALIRIEVIYIFKILLKLPNAMRPSKTQIRL